MLPHNRVYGRICLKSATGTISNLFLRIGRLSNAKDPKKDMHASFDPLMTVFKGHLVEAPCFELGIDNPESDFPSTYSVHVSGVAAKIVENFTIAVLGHPLTDCQDRVYNYAWVLCHTASLAIEFRSEGDGPRVLWCWKVLLLYFFAGRKSKYALEALLIQI